MDNRDDREVFDALSGRLEERKTIVEEHARIDTLYRMTSGTLVAHVWIWNLCTAVLSGTYFIRGESTISGMSAGQFELRMYDLEKSR